MPFVKGHTRKGRPVKPYYRVLSRWNVGFGILLLVLLFAVNRGR